MDKIEKKWPDNTELRNKVNKLVEEYNNINCYIDEIDESQREAYGRMVKFMKRLEKLENVSKEN